MKKKPIKNSSVFYHFDQRELLIAAFRYYLGRRTIATTFFTKGLVAAWGEIEEGTRDIIIRELEREFKDDDELRAKKDAGEKIVWLPLGNDCDREKWELVRKCYREDKCKWVYKRDCWATSCDEFYDSDDFGCQEIKICPNCKKETKVG